MRINQNDTIPHTTVSIALLVRQATSAPMMPASTAGPIDNTRPAAPLVVTNAGTTKAVNTAAGTYRNHNANHGGGLLRIISNGIARAA
jgi:hypothetical protein